MSSGVRALVLGASGETGKEVVKCLAESDQVTKIILVGRRKLEDTDNPKIEQRVVNFDDLGSFPGAFEDADIAFCCLGTTRAKAGVKGFVKVDHDYVVDSAARLKDSACQDFHLLTSKGANAASSFLYPKTKGQAENKIKELEFRRTCIYRPGLLLCRREETRRAEGALRWICQWADVGRWMSIETSTLGKAMVTNALKTWGQDGSDLYEHHDIVKLINEDKK